MSRLPTVSGDDGVWGEILNDYLSQSLSSDGTIRTNAVNTPQIKDGSVTTTKLADGSVTAPKLVDGSAVDGQVLTYSSGELAWATPSSSATIPDASDSTKGIVQLTSDLGGTATAPKVAKINGVSAPSGAPTNGQVLTATSGTASTWATLPSAPVTSVSGRTGAVTLTSTDVGLANVNNTSDVNKPISSATQTALDAKAATSSLATVATSGSYTDLSNRPTIPSAGTGITNTAGVLSVNYGTSGTTAAAGNDTRITGALQSSTVTTKGDILAATGSGSLNRVAIGSDNQVLTADSSQTTGMRWTTPTAAPVSSVAGRTGAVTLASSDVGLGNVNNTSDASKPISTATQSALDAKAPLISPSLTGTPLAPTAIAGTNTTQIASTAFVSTAVSNAALADATTSTKGKVQLADATDIANASGSDVLTAGLIPASQGVTGIAKVQFIPNGGTVTGSPGPYTIIIEAGA